MNQVKRIFDKNLMCGWLLCAGMGSSLVAAAIGQSTSSEVAGHTMRMGGKGKIWLSKKGGGEIDITGRGRVEIRTGDKLRTEGSAWVIWYSVADRIPYRMPAPPTTNMIASPPPRDRPRSVIYGARRQGNPPKPANRLFALSSNRQPYVLIGDEPVRFGVVTISPDVRPLKMRLASVGKVHNLKVGSGVGLRSRDIVHDLTLKNPKPLLASGSNFSVTVSFSDGSTDSASFDLLTDPTGRGSEARDTLRRALDRYSRVKPEQDDWFFRLINVTTAYEDMGCKSQAASAVLDWWFLEPDNESAKLALLGIAIDFDLGMLDRRFAPRINGGDQ